MKFHLIKKTDDINIFLSTKDIVDYHISFEKWIWNKAVNVPNKLCHRELFDALKWVEWGIRDHLGR